MISSIIDLSQPTSNPAKGDGRPLSHWIRRRLLPVALLLTATLLPLVAQADICSTCSARITQIESVERPPKVTERNRLNGLVSSQTTICMDLQDEMNNPATSFIRKFYIAASALPAAEALRIQYVNEAEAMANEISALDAELAQLRACTHAPAEPPAQTWIDTSHYESIQVWVDDPGYYENTQVWVYDGQQWVVTGGHYEQGAYLYTDEYGTPYYADPVWVEEGHYEDIGHYEAQSTWVSGGGHYETIQVWVESGYWA